MTASIVRTLPDEPWRRFLDAQPEASVFHTPEMFEVYSLARGHQPELWAAVDETGVHALLLPVRIALMNGLPRYLTTRSVVYGGLLCRGPQSQDALELLLREYVAATRLPLFTEIRHLTEGDPTRPVLEQCGFRFEDHLNFLINVALPVDQAWANVSGSARRNIRRVQARGELVIEEVRSTDQLPAWYDLLAKTYRRAHVPLADLSLFRAAFDILYPKGMAKFWLTRARDEHVAACAALLHRDTIYGWYLGFDRQYRALQPNDLMVWHLLRWGAEHGYRVFDFGGAGKPNEEYGPRKFKAKFGGALVNCGRSTRTHAPLRLALSRLGYGVARGLLWNDSNGGDGPQPRRYGPGVSMR